ncbi:MAG: DMT family transporter [Bacteroidota bacterium]
MAIRITSTTAIALGITGILLFSSKAVLVKLAYAYDIEPIPLMVLRMGFALPFYAVLAFFQKPENRAALKPKHYLGLVLSGVLGYYLASLFDFMGLQFVKASLERMILFTYPIMVLLINRVAFGERLHRNQFYAMGITYLGMVIIFLPELDQLGQGVLCGSLLILGSALSYATYLVGSGRLLPLFGTGAFTSYCMLVSCSCVLLHYGLTDGGDLFSYPRPVYGLSFAMSILATVLPTYLISAAIKKLGASTFSLFASLGPLSTIFLAYLFLGERLTLGQWMGSAVVMAGIGLISRKKKAAQ